MPRQTLQSCGNAGPGRLSAASHIVESIVISDLVVNVLYWVSFRLSRQVPGTLGPFGLIGDNHAPAARRHQLVAVETETGDVPQVPNHATVIAGTKTLGRVFDYSKSVAVGEIKYRIDVHGVAEDVDRQNRSHSSSGRLVSESAVSRLALVLQKRFELVCIHLPVIGVIWPSGIRSSGPSRPRVRRYP